MENKKAIELIDKILENLDKTGIDTETLIDNIKELRTYALEEQIPLVVKVLRLTYEHIESNNSFLIPILDDEPTDEEVPVEETKTAAVKAASEEIEKEITALTESVEASEITQE